MIITAALCARRLTRLVFMNRLCVSLIATPVGYFLILTLGIHGVVLSMDRHLVGHVPPLPGAPTGGIWREGVPQVVGRREQLQSHLVVLETAARTTGSTSPHSCTTLRHVLDDVRASIEQSLTRSSDGRFERVLGPPFEGPNGGPTMTCALVSSELIRSVCKELANPCPFSRGSRVFSFEFQAAVISRNLHGGTLRAAARAWHHPSKPLDR